METGQMVTHPTVLVVDDDQQVLEMLLLGAHGYPVVTAGNALEALDRLDDREVKIVLTDIKMPGTGAAVRSLPPCEGRS